MPRAKTNVSPVLARPSPGMSLAEHVHSELKKALQSGRFEPGERMREAAIADLLQVSRTPVREALRRLVSDNLLVSGERGIVVPQMTQSQIMELYAMRGFLKALQPRWRPNTRPLRTLTISTP